MLADNTQKEILSKIARTNGITPLEAEQIYTSAFKFAKTVINKLPVREIDSPLELRNLKSNFNLPRLGKLFLNIPKVLIVKEKMSKNKLDG